MESKPPCLLPVEYSYLRFPNFNTFLRRTTPRVTRSNYRHYRTLCLIPRRRKIGWEQHVFQESENSRHEDWKFVNKCLVTDLGNYKSLVKDYIFSRNHIFRNEINYNLQKSTFGHFTFEFLINEWSTNDECWNTIGRSIRHRIAWQIAPAPKHRSENP